MIWKATFKTLTNSVQRKASSEPSPEKDVDPKHHEPEIKNEAALGLRIDIGCGKNKREGFLGVDQFAMDGVDVVMDVRQRWPWDDNSVDEAHCSHFLEHLTGNERVVFMNELYRVLKPDAKATIITPHWGSQRAYGDFTHQWPPVSEMFYAYLSSDWRSSQAPHTDSRWNSAGYSCNFECTYGFGLHPSLYDMSEADRQEYMQWNKEAIADMVATLIKKSAHQQDNAR